MAHDPQVLEPLDSLELLELAELVELLFRLKLVVYPPLPSVCTARSI
jgi:hypothetical protein